jgi:hypothetical protein
VRYEDESSLDSAPGAGGGVGVAVDPLRLAQLVAAAQHLRQGTNADPQVLPAGALRPSALAATDPFAAGAGSRFPTSLPNVDPDKAFAIEKLPNHDAAKAIAIQRLRDATVPRQEVGAQGTRGSPAIQTQVNRPPIPLGGAPPPPGVPADWLDKHKINTLTVEQVAGILLGENGSGKYKVEPLPGRSTPDDLHRAKTAQALAIINGDTRRGKNRPRTADWQTTDAQRKTPEYQQALEAARAAYQEYKLGPDRTGGRMHFNNRFEKDVGEHEEHLGNDRIVRDENNRPVGRQKPFLTYGPFTVGGGKVWTLVYDDLRPMENKKQVPQKKTGQQVPGKIAPAK